MQLELQKLSGRRRAALVGQSVAVIVAVEVDVAVTVDAAPAARAGAWAGFARARGGGRASPVPGIGQGSCRIVLGGIGRGGDCDETLWVEGDDGRAVPGARGSRPASWVL